MNRLKLVCLILLAVLIYTRIELNRVEKSLVDIQSRYLDQADKIDKIHQTTSEFNQLSGETLLGLIDDYNETIKVYDGNVEIYNAQIEDLYSIVHELDKRQQSIINYLQ